MIEFLALSFIAGVLTVLAPCILPLLPIIVGGSAVQSSGRRVVVIVFSLGVSVLLFTLFLKATTLFISIPQQFWQLFSGGLIFFFGVVTLWPTLWDYIPGVRSVYNQSNRALGAGYQRRGFLGEVIMGAALGPVFSSCSPTYFVILAAVLPVHFAVGIAYLLAYVAGLCAFLLLIAFLGQRAIVRLGVAADPHGWFKKGMGVLFIVVGVAIVFGWDKKLEAALPTGSFAEVGIEQQLLSQGSSNPTAQQSSATSSASRMQVLTLAQKSQRYPQAPELVSPDGFINTDGQPVTLAQYRGKKVVLVDFWDYSCINCQRTFPYLKAWYEKYKDQGLVIVGVHTPEFAFEQLQSNVDAAAKRFGLTYPIVLDNHYQTWSAFKNSYWPREYLIDIDGYVVHDHAGEGEYDETEHAIQEALAERAARLGVGIVATSTVTITPTNVSGVQSPETYFGASRNEYLGNGVRGVPGKQMFTVPTQLEGNTLYLGGNWSITPEYAEASAGASIVFAYGARDVYMVATNAGAPVKIKVFQDGTPIGNAAGADVNPKTSEAVIAGDRLYTLIHNVVPGVHTIRIEIEEGTLDAYTFTFG